MAKSKYNIELLTEAYNVGKHNSSWIQTRGQNPNRVRKMSPQEILLVASLTFREKVCDWFGEKQFVVVNQLRCPRHERL